MKKPACQTKGKQTQYKANTNPIPEMSKMNVTSILTKDYENKPPSSPKKTNPIQTQNKPNLSLPKGDQTQNKPNGGGGIRTPVP